MKNKNFLLPATFLIMLTIFSGKQLFAQEDYKARELKASPQIKQRLANLRNRIQQRKLTFQVGYTYARERGIDSVTGGIKPNVSAAAARKQNDLAAQLIQLDNDARLAARVPQIKLACSANLKSWDWRKEGKVTPVKRQQCGNCWAYAAVSAFESNYLIRNNNIIDGSEQYVVSNNDDDAGTCKGGRADLAINFLVTEGTTSEAILPDSGTNGKPDPNMETPFDAVIWGWINPDNPGNPGVQSIKAGLCEHGPVATWIDAGGTFGDYTGANEYGDVYNDDDDKDAGYEVKGHFVTIIGWDETRGAWLVKNSWGQNWGFNAGVGTERGYGWIKYGTHRVGSDVSWVRAKGSGYVLPRRYYELMPLKRIPPVISNPVVKPNVPAAKPNVIIKKP